MAQHLIRAIILGTQVVGRAFAKALRNEFQQGRVAQEARRQTTESVQATRITGMSLEEAKQILNVSDLKNVAEIEDKYQNLFKMNDKASGGSFYLQSKIYRAKERIDEELKTHKPKEKKENTKETIN